MTYCFRKKLPFVLLLFLLTFTVYNPAQAQAGTDQLGAWYMYFFDIQSEKKSGFGIQGDIQHRNWDQGGDLEQLLLRAGVTYRPKGADVKFTLGYGNITSGTFGESNKTSGESRVYQEILLPQKVGNRLRLNHRFRFEQRWVEGQDTRTRYRYNLFLNLPITSKDFDKGTVYLALYNELFINGEREIIRGNPLTHRTVEIFDRNRSYGAVGYVISPRSKVQLGVMRQVNDSYGKNQLQLSLHQKF